MSIEEMSARVAMRRDELGHLLATGNLDGDTFVKVSREYAELEPVATAVAALTRARGDRAARPRVMAARVRRRRLALMAPMPRARGEQTPREETAQSRAAP